MNINNKILTLSLAALLSGLLLGGNQQIAYAAGAPEIPVSSISQMSSVISQLQEKIRLLTIQVQQRQTAPIVPVSTPKINLTAKEIAVIKTEVDRIAAEVDIIKGKVAQVLEIRRLENEIRRLQLMQIARIKQQIENIKSKIGQPAVVVAPLETQPKLPVLTPVIIPAQPTTNRKEIEEQIAKIKQQISDLTEQAEAQKIAENGQSEKNAAETAISNVTCEAGQDCSINGKSGTTATNTGNNQSKPASKGFWQSIGDFVKRLFTF